MITVHVSANTGWRVLRRYDQHGRPFELYVAPDGTGYRETVLREANEKAGIGATKPDAVLDFSLLSAYPHRPAIYLKQVGPRVTAGLIGTSLDHLESEGV